MTIQSLPNLTYVALVLVALLMPYATWNRSAATADRAIMVAIIAVAALLAVARVGSFPVVSLILLLPLLSLGVGALLGGLAALFLFAPVIWWTPKVQMGPAATGLFILLALGAAYLPRLPAARTRTKARPAILPPMA